nr:XVIPCD domain-containing protein [Stenotrophomonas sp.]
MTQQEPSLPHYRLIQLHSPRLGNQAVQDLDGLVTHHPGANARARIEDGVPVGVEDARRRSYGVVGGEIQELETRRTDGGTASALGEDQILLTKDFILEDSRIPSGGRGVREVDVPSPVEGYVGRVSAAMGTVDIYDRAGGELRARILHMNPIHVSVGDDVAYGQALGVQSNQGLERAGKHVHIEVDTRNYQHFENYMEDLASGRLAIDPDRRSSGIEPRPFANDGVIRIGESSPEVLVAQRVLNAHGHVGADGQPLAEDGVYRLSMQRAVINFQEANGLPPTGDLDPATMRTIAPPMFPPEVNPRMPDQQPPYVPLQGQADVSSAASQNPLLAQSRDAMQRLETTLGREFDHNSERMAASAACLAKDSGLSRVDHVLLSNATETKRQGETFFVVQGDPGNPAHRRAHMPTEQALNAPLEQSLQRLGVDAPAQAQNQQREQNEQVVQQAQQPHQMG